MTDKITEPLTKEQARDILYTEISYNGMPIFDSVIYTTEPFVEYTFRGLLKIAYGLDETTLI